MQQRFMPKYFIVMLCCYVAAWVIVPATVTASFPLDVVEGIVWGKEWQLGYYKHPPLPSWLLYSFYAIFGDIGPYLLSQVSVAISLWFVFLLGQQFFSKDKAFTAAILLLGIYYYTWPALEYNHNIAQLPIWAAIIYYYYRAITTNALKYWLLYGLVCGLGLLTKYTTGILLICLLLYTFLPSYRHVWKTRHIWLAILTIAIVFSPNAYWLLTHDWLPFQYALSRSESTHASQPRLSGLIFLLMQVVSHLPLIIIVIASWTVKSVSIRHITKNQRFIVFVALAPALFTAMLAIVFGIGLHDMWGTPMWNMSGLLLIAMIPDDAFDTCKRKLLKGLSIWLVIATLLMTIVLTWGAQLRNINERTDWPRQHIAHQIHQQWQTLSNCPLHIITAHYWLGGLGTVGHPETSLLMLGGADHSPWISQADVNQHGSMLLWEDDGRPNPSRLSALDTKNFTITDGAWQFDWPKQPDEKPLNVYWQAYVPKHCAR